MSKAVFPYWRMHALRFEDCIFTRSPPLKPRIAARLRWATKLLYQQAMRDQMKEQFDELNTLLDGIHQEVKKALEAAGASL